MKTVAALQILILLASVIIPEGAHRITRGCQCGDNCQCSSETQQVGTCCCSTKPRKAADKGCCSKTNESALPSCCQTTKSRMSCCDSDTSKTSTQSGCCDQEQGLPSCPSQTCIPSSRNTNDMLSSPSCGCREVIVHLTVVLMPRLQPSAMLVNDTLFVIDRLPLVSDSTLANSLLPEVPPPKFRFWTAKPNSFAA